MKNIKLVLVLIIAYVLQTVIIPDFNICGVAPNLMLVVVCSVAFLFGSSTGGCVGFFAGILLDFNQGRALGLNAFLFMYIGIVLGQFNKRFFKDNYFVAITFTGLISIVYELFVYIFGAFVFSQTFSLGNFITNVLLSALVNVIASAVTYPIMLRVNIGVELNRRIFGR